MTTHHSRNSVPCTAAPPDVVSWPTPGKEVEVNRTVLKNVAAQMREDLKKFQSGGTGTAYDIRGNCAKLTTAQFGEYTGGTAMSHSNKAAADFIDNALEGLVSSYQKIIDALEKAAKGYHDADDTVKQHADRIDPQAF